MQEGKEECLRIAAQQGLLRKPTQLSMTEA